MSTNPRRKRFAWIFILVLVLIAGILALRGPLLAMLYGGHAKPATTAVQQEKPPPQGTAVDGNPAASKDSPIPSAPSTESQTTPIILQPESGRLAFEAQGKKLGEESYQLEHLPTGEYRLSSQGFFSFNVLASDVKFEYTQETQLNADLRPLSFSLEFHGPLGLGSRSTKIQIDGEKALVSSGDKKQEIQVPKERFFMLGMFSSYVLATRIAANSDEMHLTAFMAAGFEGPKDKPQEDTSDLTIPLEFVKLAPVNIRDKATGKEREVEQYLLKLGDEEHPGSNDSVGIQLLASNGEFLGLIGASPDASRGDFRVYRMDLFPQGFEILPAK